jgi:hypothetical protein
MPKNDGPMSLSLRTEACVEVTSPEEFVSMPRANGSLNIPSRLEMAILELQGLHDLLLSDDLDPQILEDFRDTLNRVRNTAWAAQQYITRKGTEEEAGSVLSFLAGERVRAAFHLCGAISDDLKRTDIELQSGSLVQLYEAVKSLTEHLDKVINASR